MKVNLLAIFIPIFLVLNQYYCNKYDLVGPNYYAGIIANKAVSFFYNVGKYIGMIFNYDFFYPIIYLYNVNTYICLYIYPIKNIIISISVCIFNELTLILKAFLDIFIPLKTIITSFTSIIHGIGDVNYTQNILFLNFYITISFITLIICLR